MRPRPKKTASIFGLAFMDCICCGFGAVILLMIMNKGVLQGAIEESERVSESILRKVQDAIAEVRGETVIRNIHLDSLKQELSEEKNKLARLREMEYETKAQYAATKDLSEIVAEKKRALFEAKQERDTLRVTPPAWKTDVVGGIPADSEYVIFILDTSGSMHSKARKIAKTLHETLSVYPKIKGFQVMNADGVYLYPTSAGGWLKTDAQSRNDIMTKYVNWRVQSRSTPYGGLLKALSTYAPLGLEISIYVLGDDFNGGGVDQLVNAIDGYNPYRANGSKAIRIHGIGFKTGAFGGNPSSGGSRFAMLMRALGERNGGAFISIP